MLATSLFREIEPARFRSTDWLQPLRPQGKLVAVCAVALAASTLYPAIATAQTHWRSFGHDPQHTALSSVASQCMNGIRWQTPMDLYPDYGGGDHLHYHYGSPLITMANTVIVPVKTMATSGFRVEARRGSDGSLIWMQNTDYLLPPHHWTPGYPPTLTSSERLYFPGAGGTVYYRDTPDSAVPAASGQLAFYGLANYQANPSPYNSKVFINTPITADSNGNIFFGFVVTGSTPLNLVSGIARISAAGVGIRVTIATAAGDAAMTRVVQNCAPALSNDESTLYLAVSNGNGLGFGTGYLLALNSTTLVRTAKVALKDPSSGNNAWLPDDGTASPTVGPDGDVYFGVLESPFPLNHDRGWMLHFSGNLATTKTPGAFGWDDTASIVPLSMVPSYTGTSSYLIMTKYNNYAGIGNGSNVGDGVNRIAVLDPNAAMTDPVTGATVMQEVLTIAGPTPDDEQPNYPNAVREWCINTAAVDPATHSVIANNEDGKVYRWDLTTNTLTQAVTLTGGIGEAYTSTLIGVDGTVYAINQTILFAVGYINTPGARTIAERNLFYNNSFYDSDAAACTALVGQTCSDNTAIATDKVALNPGETADVNHYISYNKGINGLMIDVMPVTNCDPLPGGPLAASNFDFKVGNSTNLGSYGAAPAPLSIDVTPGGGVGGSDRIKIIWADNAIPNTRWLRTVVKSNASGGQLDLNADNIFYYGLAIGDSLTPGATRVVVSSADEIDARNHPHNSFQRVPVATNSTYAVADAPDAKYDYDKSSLVSSVDEIIARNNPTNSLTGLLLLNPAP